MDSNPAPVTQIDRKSFFSFVNPREIKKSFFIFAFLLLALLGGGILATSPRNPGTNNPPKNEDKFSVLSNATVVYGYWTEENSKIQAVDLSTGKVYGLADLDSKVKKVSVLNNQTMLFINKTNTRDHGSEIATYDLTGKKTAQVYKAENGFGIDDYVISPNKRLLSVWEIQPPEGSDQLIGGRSRVYSMDLQNLGNKYLIYDEPILENTPMRYPLAITDSGEIYLDGFIANAGAGWANGISVSNFSGTQKQELIASGTYSNQPVLSPDGKKLALIGYDGQKGSGTDTKDGHKQSLINPNTVDLFDISTKARVRLPNLPNTNRYTNVIWDKGGDNLVITLASKEASVSGDYFYNIQSKIFKKIFDNQPNADLVLASLENNKFLVGDQDESATNIGNLGQKYSAFLLSVSVFDDTSKKTTKIDVGVPLLQFLGTFPAKYFGNFLVIGDIGDEAIKNKQLQLQTFALKPSLAPKRTSQQTNPPGRPPRCLALANEQCNGLFGTNFRPGELYNAKERNPQKYNEVGPELAEAFDKCERDTQVSLNSIGACYDSPLYLYGKEGMKVEVKIGTQIYDAIPSSDGSYQVTLGKDGNFLIGGANYSKISFDYTAAIKEIPELDYGKVVKTSEVGKTLEEFGQKLGLNEREITDLKTDVGKLESNYVFVSFFSEEISKKILPIYFTPDPDVYRNIIFYLGLLSDPIYVEKPVFGKIPQRYGFTAVEVSHVVDQ